MNLKRVKTTNLITTLLVIGLLLSSFNLIKPVSAEPTLGETTFYFKDILDYQADYDSMGFTILVSEDIPEKQNDSKYPPDLIDGLVLNSEEWLIWFAFTFIGDYLDEFNGDEYGDLLEGLELFLPHPLRIVEAYEYTGNDTIEINGDVDFDLYFSSKFISKFGENDKVNISLHYLNTESLLPIPKLIENASITTEITTQIFNNIIEKNVIIPNVNHTLTKGQNLYFKIEIEPGNKTITDWINTERPILEDLSNRTINLIKDLLNNSSNPTLQNISELMDDINLLIEEVNFTKENATEILNMMISSSLVYDSINHPSSVTLPFSAPQENGDEYKKTYYLDSGNELNEQRPSSQEPLRYDLTNSANWITTEFNRSKILKDASANIYLSYKDLNILKDKIQLTAQLYDDNDIIDTSTIELEKTSILSPTENKLIIFPFNNLDEKEIIYDSEIKLEISISTNSGFNNGLLQNVELLYASSEKPSFLKLTFSETDNIQIEVFPDPADEKIIPGGEVKYQFDITSYYDDELQITQNILSGDENNWEIIIPEPFNIDNDSNETVEIIIKSTFVDLDSYGDRINVKFSITGKTGKDSFTAKPIISQDAVDYDFNIIEPSNKTIRHGEEDSYHFIIINNNTGLWPDSYSINAFSENNWSVSLNVTEVSDVSVGEKQKINVTIFIPKNTRINTDLLTFTVISNNGLSKNVTVNTTIIGPNIIENIYLFFESSAEGLGFNEIFGAYAPHFLAALLIIIIFFILIIIIFILTKKSVEITCNENIKEISPEENAIFEIKLKNPSKKIYYYNITTNKQNSESLRWDISLDTEKIMLESGQSKTLFLTVKPNDLVKINESIELEVLINVEGKQKQKIIVTKTIIKDSETKVTISNVSHWPRSFKMGDRVQTSFKVENKGNVSTSNVSVVLYINDVEKNKVEDIVIPAGGYADIDIPWIAEKGKNEINIVVK